MRSPQQATSPLDTSMDSGLRKRVCKACDRCRLKKSKCDGASPCGRCRTDNNICVFGERKKSHDKVYPKGYVEMLEQQQAQLVNGLHQLYRRIHTGQGWSGSPLQDSGSGHPLTHEILARLGALESDGRGDVESFEEDFNIMQQKLIEDGSDFAQRHDSGDSDSEHGQSPAAFLEPLSLKPTFFSEPFPLNQLPPTPPTHSPYPYPDRSGLPKPLSNASPRTRALQAHHRMNMDPAALRHQSWGPPPVNYDENTDFGHQLELPTLGHSIAGDFNRQSMAMNSMSPRGPMPDWNEEDFGAFLNPTIMI